MGKPRTYIYVLTEDGSQLGDVLKKAATSFSAIHTDDAKVDIKVQQQKPSEFENARRAFEVRRIPALAFTDEDHLFQVEETVSQYVSLDRGVLERYVVRPGGTSISEEASRDSLYNLVADFHYVVMDENLLHLKRNLTTQRVVNFLRATWEEVKDLVSISVAAR